MLGCVHPLVKLGRWCVVQKCCILEVSSNAMTPPMMCCTPRIAHFGIIYFSLLPQQNHAHVGKKWYPLVICYIAMENHYFQWKKSTIDHEFPKLFWHNQRVNLPYMEHLSISPIDSLRWSVRGMLDARRLQSHGFMGENPPQFWKKSIGDIHGHVMTYHL